MTRWVALIRGIGPTTHGRMSMAGLRAGCERAGMRAVRTVLATGNVAFDADGPEAGAARAVADVVRAHGLDNAVVARRAADLPEAMARCTFEDAAEARPSRLLIHFLPAPARAGARAADWDGPERIAFRGREAFVDYPDGIARSRLTIAVLDRMLGPGGTARNWNTARRLCAA